jgi:hypothetical protein
LVLTLGVKVTPDITNMAYENLPASAHFCRYLLLSQAYFGRISGLDRAGVEALEDHHPEFIFGLMVAQSLRIENRLGGSKGRGIAFSDRIGMANSCLFHDHLELTGKECRNRIRESEDIFINLVKAAGMAANAKGAGGPEAYHS